jgi:hypothetical protein
MQGWGEELYVVLMKNYFVLNRVEPSYNNIGLCKFRL